MALKFECPNHPQPTKYEEKEKEENLQQTLCISES
jgi:hypothetical protein